MADQTDTSMMAESLDAGAIERRMKEDPRFRVRVTLGGAWLHLGVDVKCELCRHEDWAPIASDYFDGVTIKAAQGQEAMFWEGNIICYAAICQHCGNVRIMAKDVIDRAWQARLEAHGYE